MVATGELSMDGCDQHTKCRGLRPGVAARRSNPMSKEWGTGGSHVEGQEGLQEEIPFIQGKEQQLCFVGATVKRYPKHNVRETQVRW